MSNKDIAIKVESISKIYRIGIKENRNDSFGRTVFDFVRSPLKNYRKYRSLYKFDDINPHEDKDYPDIIWALRDVSFEVKRGEMIGIIGSNGAGKSTLLKILARITDPTNGRAEILGRVSSLLEVGTGFHPELTGRENVYLNGTILGMTKAEVDKKFDEIVEFSGVEKFIDTPIKRYSSGMKVRLAFSVAAHLEPEILIIDEVLSVGDAAFQNKCIGKMQTVSSQGRTVIFVSHNMTSVVRLCDRVIWIKDGKINMDGQPAQVVTAYLSWGVDYLSRWEKPKSDSNDKIAVIESAQVLSYKNEGTTLVEFSKAFRVEITYQVFETTTDLAIACRFTDSLGNVVLTSWDTDDSNPKNLNRKAGSYVTMCEVPGHFLRPGRYSLTIGALTKSDGLGIDFWENILLFDVSEADFSLNQGRIGIVTPKLKWYN